MKKYINKFTVLLLAFYMMQSCSTDDKTVDGILEGVTNGAVLRTISSTNTFNFFDPNDTRFVFDVALEEQDAQNGGLISEIRLYQSFTDNLDDGTDNSKPEVLILTETGAGLTVSDFDLPRLDFSSTLAEALAINGLNPGEFNGGDVFSFRFELELTDGRIFSNNNLGGTVSGGSFFSSPFIYNVTLQCVPIVPFTGEYTLNLTDSEEDGWDGAFITVTIDGVSQDFTLDDGEEIQHVIMVPNGTTDLVFTYTAGNSEGDNSYSIEYNALDGSDPLEAAADGPSPTVGEIFLNICL
ncbi:hypothetical protein [Aquimarina sp. RZ0]|uniref:hypothetical protein n=1 Tax=Aquimarina sp. RZ0 TaxID=2607730 RepID=UPI0011F14843|nr:hypothetical protein [Aquimarina sp. RZ0]KAA1245709.1 hypothetical protein F0000_10740 [Aquimarina sp. RZ0]